MRKVYCGKCDYFMTWAFEDNVIQYKCYAPIKRKIIITEESFQSPYKEEKITICGDPRVLNKANDCKYFKRLSGQGLF